MARDGIYIFGLGTSVLLGFYLELDFVDHNLFLSILLFEGNLCLSKLSRWIIKINKIFMKILKRL